MNTVGSCITHGMFLKDIPGLVGLPISQTLEQERLEGGIGVVVLSLLEFLVCHNRLSPDGVPQYQSLKGSAKPDSCTLSTCFLIDPTRGYGVLAGLVKAQ